MLHCQNCQTIISSEEAEMGKVDTRYKGSKIEIDIECPKCGCVNTISGKARR